MPIPTWEFTVSDKPQMAPEYFKALDRCVKVQTCENWPEVRGRWIGSGFKVKELSGSSWYHSEDAETCGSCKSANTECIYIYAEPAQTWFIAEIELVCKDCGRFTLWKGED